jgi:excisionase family DNA binding protein
MSQPILNPNLLWKYADLAKFLQMSVNTLRRYVMYRKIPFIRIGRSIRFDKKQIAEFLKIEIRDDKPMPDVKPLLTGKGNRGKPDLISESAAWLGEKSTLYPYAEINIRVIVHDGQIRRIERTVTEKMQEK